MNYGHVKKISRHVNGEREKKSEREKNAQNNKITYIGVKTYCVALQK